MAATAHGLHLSLPRVRRAALQVMQFALAHFVMPAFTHALTLVPLPEPSSTSVLAAFTHGLTMVPLPAPERIAQISPGRFTRRFTFSQKITHCPRITTK
jgi:hypothetical protein